LERGGHAYLIFGYISCGLKKLLQLDLWSYWPFCFIYTLNAWY